MSTSHLDRLPAPAGNVSPHTLEAIRQFDTCTISNAIETFHVRLRNEGYTAPGLRCFTCDSPQLLGFAVTCRIRSANPPMTGSAFFDTTDWWNAIEQLPAPRIAVIQDMEPDAGFGSAVGEVHAAILQAFHCEGVITNGAVRDIPAVRRMQFPMFAGAVALSHAYAHIVDHGGPVEIFGLQIHSGDLLYADCHGAISIPVSIADQVPRAAAEILTRERRIIEFCRSPEFSKEKLWEIIRQNS